MAEVVPGLQDDDVSVLFGGVTFALELDGSQDGQFRDGALETQGLVGGQNFDHEGLSL
jgi:hypothetical protein